MPTKADKAAGLVRDDGPKCIICGTPLKPPARGPMPETCSGRCRQRAYRRRKATDLNATPVEPTAVPPRQRNPTRDDIARLLVEASSLEAAFRFASARAEMRFRPMLTRIADAIAGVLSQEGLR